MTTKMNSYIVRCFKHFPGYEIFGAINDKQAVNKCESWKSCELDMVTLCQMPDEEYPNPEEWEHHDKKISQWEKEFIEENGLPEYLK